MFLLDTNVVSEYRKIQSNKADPNFVRWQKDIMPQVLYISSVTLMELDIGVLAKERKDKAAGRILRAWLDNKVIPAFEGRILPIDADVALICSKMHVPDNKSFRDAFIGATAISNNLQLVTRNVKDFKDMDLSIINPWE